MFNVFPNCIFNREQVFNSEAPNFMRSNVDSQQGYHISCIFKGMTKVLLENYLYLNFPKYGTNGVSVLIIIHSFLNLS